MNGKTVKFHKYEGSSGKLTIPASISESLNWKHKDEVNLTIKTIDGKVGLFIYRIPTKTKEDYQNEIFALYNVLEKNLKKIAIKHKLNDEKSKDYNINNLIKKVKTILDDESSKILDKVIIFRNSLIHNEEFNPTLEEFRDIVDNLEILNNKLEEK